MTVRVKPAVALTLLMAAMSAVGLATVQHLGHQARYFPRVVAVTALGLCALQLVLDVVERGRDAGAPARPARMMLDLPVYGDLPNAVVARRAAILFAWLVGVTLAIMVVGFLIAVPLYVLLYLGARVRASVPATAGITLAVTGLQFVVFHYIIRVAWTVPLIPGPQRALIAFLP